MKDKYYYSENESQWLLLSDKPSLPVVQNCLKGYGLCVIRGHDFDKYNFLQYASQFGTPVNQSPEGCLVFEVKNEGYDPGHPKFRGPSTNRELSFHTDRCDVIVFHCFKQADFGGENLFVNVQTLYDIFAQESPELLEVLKQNFPYKKHHADPAHPYDYYELPVFGNDEELCVTLMTYLIQKADADPDLPSLSDLQRRALDKLQEVCRRPEVHLKIKLQPGDVLFLNNLQMLHSRTAFAEDSDRLYHRIWLSVPWSFKLPESFAVIFGDTNAGAVRGGFKKQ